MYENRIDFNTVRQYGKDNIFPACRTFFCETGGQWVTEPVPVTYPKGIDLFSLFIYYHKKESQTTTYKEKEMNNIERRDKGLAYISDDSIMEEQKKYMIPIPNSQRKENLIGSLVSKTGTRKFLVK